MLFFSMKFFLLLCDAMAILFLFSRVLILFFSLFGRGVCVDVCQVGTFKVYQERLWTSENRNQQIYACILDACVAVFFFC